MKNLKIFAETIEDSAREQVERLALDESYKDCQIRIMPDVHAGDGCTIGTTIKLNGRVSPNFVGVDVGCAILSYKVSEVDLKEIDEVIHNYVPSGKNVHNKPHYNGTILEDLYCYEQLTKIPRLLQSIGTLGGGNHFIELGKDTYKNYWLTVHSGSRNLGIQVEKYYRSLCKESTRKYYNNKFEEFKKRCIETGAIEKIQQEHHKYLKPKNVMNFLCDKEFNDYIHDMKIVQEYAKINRKTILNIICDKLDLEVDKVIESVHNYIDVDNMILRKGAISAQEGETILIPMNMRDGILLCKGLGNMDWNCSAPHGAGRLYSRSKARKELNMNDYKDSMKNVYSTCINESTIDEAPMVYKPMEEIMKMIQGTCYVIDIIKPIYNFKAND